MISNGSWVWCLPQIWWSTRRVWYPATKLPIEVSRPGDVSGHRGKVAHQWRAWRRNGKNAVVKIYLKPAMFPSKHSKRVFWWVLLGYVRVLQDFSNHSNPFIGSSSHSRTGGWCWIALSVHVMWESPEPLELVVKDSTSCYPLNQMVDSPRVYISPLPMWLFGDL